MMMMATTMSVMMQYRLSFPDDFLLFWFISQQSWGRLYQMAIIAIITC